MDDFQLLDAWQAGDKRAGNVLFGRHIDSLLFYFSTSVGKAHRRDLAQETIVRVLNNIDRFERRASFKTYLFSIAYRVMCDHFRNKYRGHGEFDPITHTVRDLLGIEQPRGLQYAEEYERVLIELRRLPVRDQAMLTMYVWQDMTAGQISTILGMPEGTIRRRMKDIIARVRRELQKDPPAASPAQAPVRDSTDLGVETMLSQIRSMIMNGPMPIAE